ncbi:Glutamine synthetase, N-terminal domain [Dillenia turbinata]|uniref:glutamine synthetase n=1 Tax=Dillenia turbinata TaxID=194707 RepID=A0AAN8UNA2_9MAGN
MTLRQAVAAAIRRTLRFDSSYFRPPTTSIPKYAVAANAPAPGYSSWSQHHRKFSIGILLFGQGSSHGCYGHNVNWHQGCYVKELAMNIIDYRSILNLSFEQEASTIMYRSLAKIIQDFTYGLLHWSMVGIQQDWRAILCSVLVFFFSNFRNISFSPSCLSILLLSAKRIGVAIILGTNVSPVLADDVSVESSSANETEGAKNIFDFRKIEDGSVISNIHTQNWRIYTDEGRKLSSQGRWDEAKSVLSACNRRSLGKLCGRRDPHVASAFNTSDLLNLNLSDTTEKVIAEYIWVGGSGLDLRSKAKTLSGPVDSPQQLPKWNYDGSSTGQAPGEDSEVILYPQAIFRDPFRRGKNILVMCDAYTPAGVPIPTNKRYKAAKIFSHPDIIAEEPWYGIEQEYTLLQKEVKWPVGWQLWEVTLARRSVLGPYYCGIGVDKAFGRDIVDAHYKASCMQALTFVWEFQVGTSVGISAGDELWVVRYILERITEIAGVGDWNGAGAHTNYSTKSTRNDGGYEVIKKAIEKLGLRHKEHIAAYGEGNERRLIWKT